MVRCGSTWTGLSLGRKEIESAYLQTKLVTLFIGNDMKSERVPICEKITITIDEAIAYSGIGRDKLYSLCSDPMCSFCLKNGRNILIKRRLFEKFLEQSTEI